METIYVPRGHPKPLFFIYKGLFIPRLWIKASRLVSTKTNTRTCYWDNARTYYWGLSLSLSLSLSPTQANTTWVSAIRDSKPLFEAKVLNPHQQADVVYGILYVTLCLSNLVDIAVKCHKAKYWGENEYYVHY